MRKQPHNFDPQQSPRLTDAPDGLAEQQEGQGPLHEDTEKALHSMTYGFGMQVAQGEDGEPSQKHMMPIMDRRSASNRHEFEQRSDGTAVLVQPSFDDPLDREKTSSFPPTKLPASAEPQAQAWQDRGPVGDEKEGDVEPRNPASPNSHKMSDFQDDDRKHRRAFSGEASNPPAAHRRIDSIGHSATVRRDHGIRKNHKRGDSGLDILSAAVGNVTKDVLASASGAPVARAGVSWDLPESHTQQARVSIGQVSTGSFEHPLPQSAYGPPPPGSHAHMNPPQRRPASSTGYPQMHAANYNPPLPFPSQYGYPTYYPPGAYGPRTVPPPHHPGYGHVPPFPQRPPDYGKSMMYRHPHPPPPPPREQRIDSDERLFGKKNSPTPPSSSPPQPWNVASNTQGVQTFVTAISVGGNKTMVPTAQHKNASTGTDDQHPPVPSQIGHHRKLSSFSSLGTMIGQNLFPANEAPDRSKHHRHTSSSISLLGLDVGLESTEDAFLRNLQSANSMAGPSPPPSQDSGSDSPTRLAEGGASKRVRRKCIIDNCENRVVQGGLCISHGAKRKTCKHPGCNKNVKKAGLCSTHGPARKRCDADGCVKVAVQGGKCIAHGARKKMCSVDACNKQAILNGMCKKHHDLSETDLADKPFCQETTAPAAASPVLAVTAVTAQQRKTHHRGLSIFQEMSADAVSSILNDDAAAAAAAAEEAEARAADSVWG